MSLINANICVSDIPKDKFKKADNGKIYCNITIAERKEPDKFENTHTIYVSQSKEERDKRVDKKYIGSGKEFSFSPIISSPDQVESMPVAEDVDLPF